MESAECKISVWVCREEKLVLGVSKRTTCADVVNVLLEEQGSRRGPTAHSHCIVEKWRGFERILPHKTRILRLWVAWGEEQRNVSFVLVKSDASLAARGARSAEARVVPSRQGLGIPKGTARSPVGSVSPEKQRRVVRKAFRKLEKINKKKKTRAARRDASCAERMETLVHAVVSQDHTIRQQVHRIAQLDEEIERCEAKVHFDRTQINGVNYVQNCYLVDTAPASSPSPGPGATELASGETLATLEEQVRRYEAASSLQEELLEQEALIESITAQIQEELNHRWTHRRREELCRASSPSSTDTTGNDLFMEEERIKTQLDASLYIGLRLSTDLQAIRSDLELSQQIYSEREKEMRDLLEKVNSLDMKEGEGEERCCHGGHDMEAKLSTLEMKCGWMEQARGLSKDHSVNDEDSDTGLSSLHSQDSDSLTVWESLV